jgi:cell division protein FtsQ
VSEVDVSDTEDVRALITAGSSDILVHFGQEDFLKRYREFEQHLGEWRQEYPKLASADIRYEGQIVLEMQGGGGAASTVNESAPAPADATATTTATAKATTSAKANAGVLPLRVAQGQDDGEKQTTATAAATRAAATKGAATRAAAAKAKSPVVSGEPAASRSVVAKVNTPVVKTTGAKIPAAKKAVVAKTKAGSGVDAANQRIFAQLAAAHKAALARAAKSGGAGSKSGVTL